jgi:eukaryotic-like serine/threonine-protein kinase
MPKTNTLQPGDPSQLGQFDILGRLGAGGMGVVFLGRSPGGRLAAVKVVRTELADDPEFRTRFGREIDAARKVSGAFTAPVLDADPDAERPWLATAYVDGPSLLARVRSNGRLPVEEVRALGAGLAEALAELHRVGLVHRDVKPGNVLLAADGPRLIDFGIIRSEALAELTETGTVLGSAGFMAPEQAEGHETGPAADVFAVGAVLVFAALGHGPFGTGTAATLLVRTITGEPDLDGLSEGLHSVVSRCLARDPSGRPTVPQLLDLLRSHGETESESQPADPDPVQSRPTFTPFEAHSVPAASSVAAPPKKPLTPLPGIPRNEPSSAPAHPSRSDAGPSRRAIVIGSLTAVAAVGGITALAAQSPSPSPGPPLPTFTDLYPTTSVTTPAPQQSLIAGPDATPLWSGNANLDAVRAVAAGGGSLYAVGSSDLAAVDPRTGKQQWKVALSAGGSYETSPFADASGLYTAQPTAFAALSPADGHGLWSVAIPADGASEPVTVLAHIGSMFVCKALISVAGTLSSRLIGVDASSQSLRWHTDIDDTSYIDVVGPYVLIVSFDGGKSTFTAYRPTDWSTVWQKPGPDSRDWTANRGGEVTATSKSIFFAYSSLMSMDLTTGRFGVTTPMTDIGVYGYHGLAASGGLVYVVAGNTSAGTDNSTGTVEAFHESDGKVVWSASPVPVPVDLAPAMTVDDGDLYISNTSGASLVALDAASGNVRWRWQGTAPDYGDVSIVADNGQVYMLTNGQITAFAAR